MSTAPNQSKKNTIVSIQKKADSQIPITMLTAYDASSAALTDAAGVDMILVGDSLGMVMLGYQTTLPVTMEDMLLHCRSVARSVETALLVGDLPFMSYQISKEQALTNAGRLIQEGGMDAVKLEGGRQRAESIRAIVEAGIPVMGHIGLTPQSVNQLGGFRLQGKSAAAARQLLEDALILEDSGCFSIVLEMVPAQLAGYISDRLKIPTIGIGAGAGCDGQVLVYHDLLGLFNRPKLKFVKKYLDLYPLILQALQEYINEVRGGTFPAAENATSMPEEEWQAFLSLLNE